ncbi:MAG: restriction endonuclease subunit S, partial [Oscillospiraceae bacterium]|nr:restriction endonuclease subunit S [Oscillospiraceae bacterium]
MGKWEMVRLEEVCEVVSGTTPKSNVEKYWNGTQNWVTPAELREDRVEITETDRKITDLAIKESRLKPFPAGTVLLSS